MNLAPVNVPLSFEVTFDSPSLYVGMSVFNNSGVSPVLVSGPVAMSNVVGNMYQGKYTPPIAGPYLIFKAVYTDGTFDTLNQNYPSGSESIEAQDPASSGAECTLLGFVSDNMTLLGFINDSSDLIGIVNC